PASETIVPVSETIAYADPQIVARGGGLRKLLAQKAREYDSSRPIVMTMTIGGKVQYKVDEVRDDLDVLSLLHSFKVVVFLDSNKQVVAYMEAWRLKDLVEEADLADELVEFINSGQKDNVADYAGVVKKTISKTSTNIEALRQMQEQNLEAL